MSRENFERLLTEHELAEMTGVALATLRRWRLLGRGPKFLKLGATVRYTPQDVSAWLASRPCGGGQ
jgi:predicted DNA-binding transcriptional regulator AlpA